MTNSLMKLKEGAPDPEKKDDATPAPDANKEAANDKKADEGAKPPARPENVPEKFWDAEKGTLNSEGLLKSYSELEKEMGKLTAKNVAPKEYKVNIPEAYKGKAEIPAEDPMLKSYLALAKNKGYSQEKVDADIEFFVDHMFKKHEGDMKGEIEKLGGEEKATKRVTDIGAWAKNNLTEKSQAVLDSVATSAEVLDLLDEMRKLASVQKNPPDSQDLKTEGLTEEKVRAKMKDERYWKTKDPAFIKEVTEDYQRLYPEPQGKSA